MKIGIHHRPFSYSEHWINYCKKNKIPYKIVNAYRNNIVHDLEDCDIFLWHHHQANPKDVLFAKQLLFSLEQNGKIVYPDWRTGWHFDDKLGQKYLLESFGFPLAKSYVFYDMQEAIEWANTYSFPAVFKLRNGAGSYNVKLVSNRAEALRLIKRAFGSGFRQFDPWIDLKERYSKYRKGLYSWVQLFKATSHFFFPYQIEKTKGKERGYIYFQEFIPDCRYDIRVQLVGLKGYAMIRYVRKNDFRASGSGNIDYDGSKVEKAALELSQRIARALQMQSMAIDLLPYKGSFKIAEISYAFGVDKGELDFGWFDEELKWHNGVADPYKWIIEDCIARLNQSKNNFGL